MRLRPQHPQAEYEELCSPPGRREGPMFQQVKAVAGQCALKSFYVHLLPPSPAGRGGVGRERTDGRLQC